MLGWPLSADIFGVLGVCVSGAHDIFGVLGVCVSGAQGVCGWMSPAALWRCLAALVMVWVPVACRVLVSRGTGAEEGSLGAA